MNNKLFSGKGCGGCDTVKKFLAENNIDMEIVDVYSEEGSQEAQKWKLRSIPAMLVGEDTLVIGSERIIDWLKD